MDKAIIFLNGDISDYSFIRKFIDKSTLLIGCDGGTDKILKLGFKPDVVVGDFDSVDPGSVKNKSIETVSHPKDKDYTDSEAAIRYAIEKGIKQIKIVGLSGSRIDHMIGNIFLLNKLDSDDVDMKIIEGEQEIYLIKGEASITGNKGDAISFIPIFGDVKAISSSGLKYPLEDYTLSMQGNTGISNQLIGDKSGIVLSEGKLLVIHSVS